MYCASIMECAKQIEVPVNNIENWASWAIKQADRIEPVHNFVFLKDVTNAHEYGHIDKNLNKKRY